jgi:hypothetical protein
MNGKQQSIGSQIATSIVAALLGLVLILDARVVEEPLRTISIVGGAIFMLAALAQLIKRE